MSEHSPPHASLRDPRGLGQRSALSPAPSQKLHSSQPCMAALLLTAAMWLFWAQLHPPATSPLWAPWPLRCGEAGWWIASWLRGWFRYSSGKRKLSCYDSGTEHSVSAAQVSFPLPHPPQLSPSNFIPRAQRLLLTKKVESFPSPDVPSTKCFRWLIS